MKVVGLDSLKRWNPTATADAVRAWQAAVLAQLAQQRGYAVEAKEDLLLAAFRNVSSGLLWAKCCIKALLDMEWWAPRPAAIHACMPVLDVDAPVAPRISCCMLYVPPWPGPV